MLNDPLNFSAVDMIMKAGVYMVNYMVNLPYNALFYTTALVYDAEIYWNLVVSKNAVGHNIVSLGHNMLDLAYNVAGLGHNVPSLWHNVASLGYNVASLAYNVIIVAIANPEKTKMIFKVGTATVTSFYVLLYDAENIVDEVKNIADSIQKFIWDQAEFFYEECFKECDPIDSDCTTDVNACEEL